MKHFLALPLVLALALLAASVASADKPGPPASSVSFDDTGACGFLVHFEGTRVSANFGTNRGADLQGTLSNPANGRSVSINTGGNFQLTQNADGTITIDANGGLIWLFDSDDPHAAGIYVLYGHQVVTFDNTKPEPIVSFTHDGGESQNYCSALA